MNLDHGEVSIRIENNIIFVEMKGAFNEYGAQKYTHGVMAEVKRLQGAPFSLLVNIEEIEGGTPEAFAELENYNIWLNNQNLIAKAMVAKSATTLELIDRLSPARRQQTNMNFESEVDALIWLKSLQKSKKSL